jgi:hypothetical protein
VKRRDPDNRKRGDNSNLERSRCSHTKRRHTQRKLNTTSLPGVEAVAKEEVEVAMI